ncbi:MAG TPA: outer membrane beta-barrel protein [Vicinamibacterales bacterium]
MLTRALLVLLAAAWAGSAAAQPLADEEEPVTELTWRPSVALTSLGYDTNVLNDHDDPKRDFVTAVRTGLRPSLRLGRAVVAGEVALAYTYYAQLVRERGIDGTGRARVTLPFSRFRLHGSGSYFNQKERFNEEVDARARHTATEAAVGVDVALGALTALTFTAADRRVDFDESGVAAGLGRTLDRTERAFTAGLRYELTPLTTVAGTVTVGRHRFVFSPERDGESAGADLRIDLADDAILGGHGRIGWRRVTLADPQVPSFEGLAGSAGLTARIGGSTRVGVGARRDLTFSVGEVLPYYVESAFGGSVGRTLGERFEIGARVERVRLDYVRLLDAVDPGGYREHVTILGGSLTYRTPAGLEITFHVDQRLRRTSADISRNYDSLRFYTAIGPVLSF